MIKLTNYSIALLPAHSGVPRQLPQCASFLPQHVSGPWGQSPIRQQTEDALKSHQNPVASEGQKKYELANGLLKWGEAEHTSVSGEESWHRAAVVAVQNKGYFLCELQGPIKAFCCLITYSCQQILTYLFI